MTDRSYVFRLQGDASGLQTVTDAAGRALDALATKSEASAARSVAADRSATQSRNQLTSATTALGALRPTELAVKSLGVSAGQTTQALRQLPSQFTDIVTQLAGGQNPLLILIQQGGQIKDSFGGIGPTFTALAGALNPVTTAIGATAIALAGVGFAAYSSVQQVAEFNKTIVLTGNHAGVTMGQMTVLASTIADAAKVSAGAAREALQSVVSSGAFGPTLLQPVATAVARMADLTGETTDKITADFARMGDGVAKYAAEHNKSMHLISAAQYEQIKALEEAGKAEQAQAVYIGILNARLAEHDKSIGGVTRAWREAKSALSEYVTWLGNAYTGTTTVDAQLLLARQRLAAAERAERANNSRGGFDTFGRYATATATAREDVAVLERSKALGEQVAAATAASNKRQADGIAGSQVVDGIKKEIDKRSEAIKKVQEYTVAVQKMRAAGNPNAPSAAEEAATIAGINEKYKTRGQKDAEKLDNRFTERLVALQQEGIRLEAETRSFELYGRSIDKARVAVLDLEIAQGKLKGINPSQIAQLRAAAAADDAKDQRLDQAKNYAEVDKSIAKLREQATLKQTNARDSEVARRLAEMEAQGVKVGTEAYIENAASIRTWVGIKHDQLLERALAQQQRENDTEVAKLEEENRLLGASTLERQKAIAVLRLQAQARKDIAANPGQTAQIIDASIASQDKLTAAIERSYTASRSFEAGASSAIQRYVEDATNGAAMAERSITGVFQRGEDALLNFVHTGKFKFGDLWRFMADEYIRNWYRMQVASAASGSGGSGGWLSAIAKLFGAFGGGSTSGGGSGFYSSSLGDNASTVGMSLAVGTNYVPYDGFKATLHEGEAVQPKKYNPAAGGYIPPLTNQGGTGSGGGRTGRGGGNVYVTNNSPAQISDVEQDDEGNWHVLVEEAARRAEDRVVGSLASGKGKSANALRSRGVNLNGSNVRRN